MLRSGKDWFHYAPSFQQSQKAWLNEDENRVEKPEFARQFSQITCAFQTRWELIRVDHPVTQTKFCKY